MDPSPVFRWFINLLCLSIVSAVPAEASAQVEAPSLSFAFEASLVSDYRDRGVSWSNLGPALQGGVMLEHETGAYAGIWGATMSKRESGAATELNFYAGYATELAPGLNADVMAVYNVYPEHGDYDYFEGYGTLSYQRGAFTPKLLLAYAPSQWALRNEDGKSRDNLYMAVGFDAAVADTPLILITQLGHEAGAFDGRESGGKWDWQIGCRASLAPFDVAISYVDSDIRWEATDGDNLAGAGVVASLLLSF